jgi:gas vesicle protein
MGTGAVSGAVAVLIIHRPQSAAELRAKMPLAERIKLCLDLAKIKLATRIDYLDSYARRGILYLNGARGLPLNFSLIRAG